MVILKRARILSVLLVILLSFTFLVIKLNSTYATNYCVSEKCKAAEAAEIEAKKKSNEASAAAATYQEEVKRLNAEIAVIESEIAHYEAEAEDLAKQITETEQKLEKQQNALAKLIVEMHFETEVDPIIVLAGSESISDLVEKEAREEVVEEQVTLSAKEIKELKISLEDKKAAVETLLSDAKSKRNEVANARARQQELVNKYASDASSYLADSEAARREKEAEIESYRQAYIASLGRKTVIVDPGLDSYAPALKASLGYSCPTDNWRYYSTNGHHGYTSWHGGYICECVGYAGYKTYEYWGLDVGWGDAKYWGSGARNAGYRVDDNPEPHSVGYYTSGWWGHVVWIENVNSDGTIDYSEYNGNITANFSYIKGASAAKFSYIHFD